MPLVVPKIDDRNYEQILSEALARIPVHNPEWTNFNDTDPGVTLVQLFAFMTESMLYRSNLIPERNRIKFLQLLGIPLQPAAAAQGIVTFSNPRGALQTVTLSPGLDVFAGRTPFRTVNGLDVLPVEARVYYKSPLPEAEQAQTKALYQKLYSSFQGGDDTTSLGFYETKLLESPANGAAFPVVNLARGKDTLDGSLWMALLARSGKPDILKQTRQAIAKKVLTLGVLPALTDAGRALRPGAPPSAESQSGLLFQIPIGEHLPQNVSQRVARYRTLDALASGDLLSEPGIVQLQLPDSDGLQLWDNFEPLEAGVGDFPPSLENTDIEGRVVTWIRVRLREAQSESSAPSQLSARLGWLGINAARATQQVRVSSENLGRGTGRPDQSLKLVNTPVIPRSVRLYVNGEPWQEIDDLMLAGSEVPVRSPRSTPAAYASSMRPQGVKVFTVDRESGEIRFGDGLHGARPPANATIVTSYDYGGGRSGNVGIDAIKKSPMLPAGLKVTNPIPTWGGDEAESVAQGEKRIPSYLRHRDRLVSAADYKEIAWRTPGVDLGRVEVLPLFHPKLPDVSSEGVVTVMVIPLYDRLQPEAPKPDRLFLDTVCEHLDPRRIITTELYVRGPEYLPIWVSVGIDVIPGRDIASVREAVKSALRVFLSPLTGGIERRGWPLGKAVERLELWAAATRVEGVSKVNGVSLAKETGPSIDRIPMEGLELPWLVGLSVQPGDPVQIDDLRGDSGVSSPVETVSKVVPVPVVPAECE